MKIFLSRWHNLARNTRSLFLRDQGVTVKNPDNQFMTFTEYQWVNKVALTIVKKWRNTKAEIVLVPEGLTLADRVKWINARAWSSDICIELHMNSGPVDASGSESFYLAYNKYAETQTEKFHSAFMRVMGGRNRWIKIDTATRFGRLWFIRDTHPLAILVELGFLTNKNDRDAVWVRWADAVIFWLNSLILE